MSYSSNKSQHTNKKQFTKANSANYKGYDLSDRTLYFARYTREYVKSLPKKLVNIDDCKQVIRSSGSIGANYIEANESSTKKEFLHRLRISKKEAKETKYWLRLIEVSDDLHKDKNRLLDEVDQIIRILGAIIEKSK